MKSIDYYTNYRQFLRDFYKDKKKTNPNYSYRLFSRMAGFKAANLLKLVMDDERNLSRDSASKFAKGLGLDERGTSIFLKMVETNQGRFKHVGPRHD